MKKELPPYVCNCCGYANGDMFEDYIKSNAEKLTYAEVIAMCDEFDRLTKEYYDEKSRAVANIRNRKAIK